ncbi:hypothetical protein E2C01_037277 [Portunus trituberculatus]|uniref:Uncharacterized protein n=1 Tax=Portunus trituberculatus TaxID=210409 RepID=A0A5B7FE87_PORTR|nr:hypothetical protein [Portunus trituberculatus]
MNILGLSFTHNLNWKLHISSLAKTASRKLGILRGLHQFLSPPPTANSVQGPYPSLWGGIKNFSSHEPLTVFSLCLTAEILHLFLSFIAISMLTTLLIFLTAYLSSSCDLTA